MPAADRPRMGLRERKKQETRDALSQAAVRLIVERGWTGVTEEDIAAAANVSARTFRNYFSGKAEAVAARHVDRVRRIAGELRARPAAEPLWEAVTAAVREQFVPEHDIDRWAHGRQQADSVRLMLTEPALQGELAKAHAAAEAELTAAIGERTGTDPVRDLYPKLVAAALGATLSAVITHCLQAEPPLPLGPVLGEAIDRLTSGLPVP
ncbi:acyl-CoA-like ligand-binding transcription factor [Marinitenerispora sediminis]|uniref:TetR family transcriptional regulator n=1 Tax=Marinitenerispora sediminis TaxID=1931232 RepID=A0A368SY56_9ACTN|nr:TetR family transcriptional regulator [Marinitenerispora sediminis]RCV47617.1 TetR family transcriptional regulator [Marinitenerispora sediminis]RCV48518.1 TetR family transcriptional regulator [Marinitenerispora sediminis]